jgi:TPR repeat protein
MSQLQLGNLYMTGQGVPQNNQAASTYLQQANDSITTLMKSHTPQSQQLLSSLPGSPEQIKIQLQITIRQLESRR